MWTGLEIEIMKKLTAEIVDSPFSIDFKALFGYIDVGDGCWRSNVLVTSLRCW